MARTGKTYPLMLLLLLLSLTAFAFIAVSCGDDDASDGGATATATEAGGAAPSDTPEGEATESSETSFPLTIEGSDGVAVTLEAPPRRIVSLSAHATEILCAIGAGDQIVAVERWANCPLGSDEKPALDAYQPNLEAIASYDPDFVYVFNDRDGIVEALRRAGITVLYLELPSSIEGVLEEIELFGRITGHEQEAAELVQSMRERIEAVKEKIADIEVGPRIFHELDPTYYTVAPNSFVGDFYNILKAQNIAEGAETPYPQLSEEVIIERDPEVIILADQGAEVTPETVKARPGWDQITAVKNDRICAVDPDIVSRPGPRVVEGLEALAKCLYPERFQ